MTKEQLLLELKPIRISDSGTSFLFATEPWVFALLALLLVGLGISLRKPWLRYRQQRLALYELSQINQRWVENRNSHHFAQSVSRLLRRYALLRFPEAQIAGLSGESWLAFLDQRGGHDFFCSASGRALLVAPYCPEVTIDPEPFVIAIRKWIKANT